MKLLTIITLTALLFAGCRSVAPPKESFSIYVESWEHITFDSPRITDGKASEKVYYSKRHSKEDAERVFADNSGRMLRSVDVMLGKNCQLGVEELQNWLIAQGFEDIVFRLAMSSGEPPVIRIYSKGKITEPQQEDSFDSK